MAQEETETFRVVGGPSKFDLMAAIFVGHTNEQPEVEFSLVPYGETSKKSFFPNSKHVFKARVLGVEREDGSGESWIIKGRFHIDGKSRPFKGYYTSQHRTGHFTITFD